MIPMNNVTEERYDLDSSDFMRLDLESAERLIRLAAKWQDANRLEGIKNDAIRAARKLTVDSPAMKHWRKSFPAGFRGEIRCQTMIPPALPRAERLRRQLEGLDYAKLEAQTLAQVLAAYPGARVEAQIHDEWVIRVD